MSNASNRNFGLAVRERDRRIASDLDSPGNPGTAQSGYLGPEWDAFSGALREKAAEAAANGMGFRADLSGVGSDPTGALPRPGDADTARSNRINAYLGQLTDENAIKAQVQRDEAAKSDAIDAQQRERQTAERAAATAYAPGATATGRSIVRQPDGSYVTTAGPAAPADPRTLMRQMAPGAVPPEPPLSLGKPEAAMVDGKRVFVRAGSDGLMYDMARKPIPPEKLEPPPAKAAATSGIAKLYDMTDPKSIADGVRSGDMIPDLGTYGRPVQGAVASELRKPGPNGEPPFNLADAKRTWDATKRLNSTLNGQQQVKLDESIRSGLEMFDKVDELSSQWDGMGLGALSRANLKAAKEGALGQDAAKIANELEGQIGQLTSDIATIEQGGGTPTDPARATAEKSLQSWWGDGTIKAMTAQGRANMKIRQRAREDTTPLTVGNTGPNTAVVAPPPAVEEWVRDAKGKLVKKGKS